MEETAVHKEGTTTMNRASVTTKGTKFPDLHGYLKKKSRHDRWQKRWFEANDHYLTYYKSPSSDKLLACIDLYQTGVIKLAVRDAEKGNFDDADDSVSEFSLELGDRFYIIKAESRAEANKWVTGLNDRKVVDKKPEPVKAAATPTKKGQNEGRFTSFVSSPDAQNSSMDDAVNQAREMNQIEEGAPPGEGESGSPPGEKGGKEAASSPSSAGPPSIDSAEGAGGSTRQGVGTHGSVNAITKPVGRENAPSSCGTCVVM